ncbi:MAG: 3-hydroxyacyl-[acyl-carrier-protein] dehydratase FabZ [Deltaproteobacteria bacterium RBG_13_58_19]|nr:MAG: 3-hydroxyacyl-[acyl-carrier-protein] dehydratase FabZ [Deltaproteobacteria bacterium RBG_13_58_19]
MGVEEIKGILPHRYPFLMVDRILSVELGKRIVGLKNVTVNEPFFPGHFPQHPIMPGVLIVEALAQVGGILALLSTPEHLGNPAIYLMTLDKVRFRKPVVPGDQLILELEVLKGGKKYFKMRGKAFVDQKLVTEAELMAAVGQGEE